MRTLDALVAPAFAAHCDISVVTSDLHLFSLSNDLSVAIDSGVDDSLSAAIACRLNLIDRIGDLKEPARTLEEMSLKVGAESVAYHVAGIVVHHPRKLIYLICGQELSLIYKNPFRHIERLLKSIVHHIIEIGIGIYPLAFPLDSDAGTDYVFFLTRIHHRLQTHVCHAALLEIIGGGQKHGGLSRTHGAIAEI